MKKSITELKIKAKKQQKWLAQTGTPQPLTMCQQQIACEAGFNHWHHASEVLTGAGQVTQDYGSLWYHPKCAPLLNLWFANREEAKQALLADKSKVLVPFKTQYILVTEEYLTMLGVNAVYIEQLFAGARDLVEVYGTALFDEVAMCCILHRLK
ncbi:hypothetical protein [Planctobacterium marinum]|uniref:hypothetical protein n=1 Tax=Planctobacterium marinum TaxID=1631968 RepID=UPI001E3E669F|nr:hypothetical protein [Planctobacterium marinum]MCC2604320.1 hypothetical protein [Planctobacterium marinum]